MKKILFVTPHIIGGGVEKALIEFLKRLQYYECEVDVLFVKKIGLFADLIPNYVQTNEIDLTDYQKDMLLCGGAKKAIMRSIKNCRFFTACKIALKKFCSHPFPEFNGNFSKLPIYEKKYDIAICYHMHMPFIVAYTAEKIYARKKIIWIHNDFLSSGFKVDNIKKYLNKFDKFYAVSEQLKSEFISKAPEFKNNTEVFHNLIDIDCIRLKSKEKAEWYSDDDKLKILSIGRLNKQKGFDLAIKAADLLRQDNLNFIWYILGEGEEKDNLLKMISMYKLNAYVKLLGFKENPYSYINECDIYVQTSRHEGWSLVLQEACVLCKPLISTPVAGAKEQLNEDKGIVTIGYSAAEISSAIKEFVNNPQRVEECVNNLSKSSIIDDFYKFKELL